MASACRCPNSKRGSRCTPTFLRPAGGRLQARRAGGAGALVALTDAGSDALQGEGRLALAKTLRRHLAAYFDVVVLPRHWRFRIALPFDERGKLPVAAVAAAFGARAD